MEVDSDQLVEDGSIEMTCMLAIHLVDGALFMDNVVPVLSVASQ